MSESEPQLPSPDSLPAPAFPAKSNAPKEPAADAPFQLSQEIVTPEGPAEAPAPDALPAPAYEHLGELPATYGTQSLYLVAYDPRQLFAYWDVDWSAAPGGNPCALRVHRADGSLESQTTISPADAGRYLGIEQSGGTYFVELGVNGRDGQWRALAKSGYVTMPPEGIAGEMEPKFATLPFHLSFQRLVELLQHTMRPGEDLTAALARLQREGAHGASSLLGSIGSLTAEQFRTLEMLLGESLHLGEDVGASLGGDNSEVSALSGQSSYSRFGASAGEHLSSGAMSSEARLSVEAAGSETLSSGAFSGAANLAAGGLSSENLSSGAQSSYSRFAAAGLSGETLSSGAFSSASRFAAGGLSSENLSSGAFSSASQFAARGMGSETLSSGAFSSASQFAVRGLSSESLSSGAFSSASRFAAGGLSSENLSSGAVSSYAFQAAGAGGSENLSSYGGGLSSEAYAAAAARGSEWISSAAAPGYGVSSEAWRRAVTYGAGASSSDLAASESALFQRALESSHLERLSSLFSGIHSEMGSGGLGGSSSSSGGSSDELSSRSRW